MLKPTLSRGLSALRETYAALLPVAAAPFSTRPPGYADAFVAAAHHILLPRLRTLFAPAVSSTHGLTFRFERAWERTALGVRRCELAELLLPFLPLLADRFAEADARAFAMRARSELGDGYSSAPPAALAELRAMWACVLHELSSAARAAALLVRAVRPRDGVSDAGGAAERPAEVPVDAAVQLLCSIYTNCTALPLPLRLHAGTLPTRCTHSLTHCELVRSITHLRESERARRGRGSACIGHLSATVSGANARTRMDGRCDGLARPGRRCQARPNDDLAAARSRCAEPLRRCSERLPAGRHGRRRRSGSGSRKGVQRQRLTCERLGGQRGRLGDIGTRASQ